MCRIGWLPHGSSKFLSKIVINLAAPCVVIITISEQKFDTAVFGTLAIVSGLYVAQYAFQFLAAVCTGRALKVKRAERGVYQNLFLYTNNGFMGFPVAYAIFGSAGMFCMVIINILMPFFMYTHGTWNVKKDAAEISSEQVIRKIRVSEFLNPPIVASLLGLVIFFFKIPLHPMIGNLLNILGSTMTPLAMLVIGIQLTESSPRRLMMNPKLLVAASMRVLIMPAVFITVAAFLKLDPLVLGVLSLNIMLPSAAMPVTLAEEYGADATFAAEGNFLSTLFSMATIPAAVAIFGSFL